MKEWENSFGFIGVLDGNSINFCTFPQKRDDQNDCL